MKTKQNISNQTNNPEQLSPLLEQLRKEVSGFKVPDGYFDSLSPRIVDAINSQQHSSLNNVRVPIYRKPWVWAPSLATVVVAALLIFVVPAKKSTVIPVNDEWTEINMAYDPSYAHEAMFLETSNIEKGLENNAIDFTKSTYLTGQNEPSQEEIAKFLKEHEYDASLLNEY